ncbi:hypothetical protein V8C26DRAFT_414304 [Trichoderma gracile]
MRAWKHYHVLRFLCVFFLLSFNPPKAWRCLLYRGENVYLDTGLPPSVTANKGAVTIALCMVGLARLFQLRQAKGRGQTSYNLPFHEPGSRPYREAQCE